MAADDLTRPLGLPRKRKPRRTPIVALVAPPLAIAIGLVVFFAVRGGPDDPANVVARIDGADQAQTGSIQPDPAAASASAPVYAPQSEPLVEVKPTGGLREVGSDEVIISDPSKPAPIRLAAAPREDLTEPGEDGLLPRIGDDGTRPLDAYARPTAGADGMKRVAIVVGGIGIEGETGQSAIASLPGEVTLGLAPYGKDLPATVAEARAGGHEILLQLPMEPYNYPDIDPGPNTLTVEADAGENLSRLHWLLGRMTTYVGVMNYMGARFTGDDRALAPVIGDVACARADLSRRWLLGAKPRRVLCLRQRTGDQGRSRPRRRFRAGGHRRPARSACRDRPEARLRHSDGNRLPLDHRPGGGLRQGGRASRHRPGSALRHHSRRRDMSKKDKKKKKKARTMDDLPYRPCVGIALFNPAGRVWVGRRSDEEAEGEGTGHWWQMPQGGLDEGEDPYRAALRELYEETSIRSVSLIREAPGWLTYDLPPDLVGISWKGRYRGQKQKWFALRFEGDESEIDVLDPGDGDKPEFSEWRWEELARLPELIVPFKRPVYEGIVAAFRDIGPA